MQTMILVGLALLLAVELTALVLNYTTLKGNSMVLAHTNESLMRQNKDLQAELDRAKQTVHRLVSLEFDSAYAISHRGVTALPAGWEDAINPLIEGKAN